MAVKKAARGSTEIDARLGLHTCVAYTFRYLGSMSHNFITSITFQLHYCTIYRYNQKASEVTRSHKVERFEVVENDEAGKDARSLNLFKKILV